MKGPYCMTHPTHDSVFGDTYHGVPNPMVPHLHPWPTRYFGPNFTMPQATMPFVARPWGRVPFFGVDSLGQAPIGLSAYIEHVNQRMDRAGETVREASQAGTLPSDFDLAGFGRLLDGDYEEADPPQGWRDFHATVDAITTAVGPVFVEEEVRAFEAELQPYEAQLGVAPSAPAPQTTRAGVSGTVVAVATLAALVGGALLLTRRGRKR